MTRLLDIGVTGLTTHQRALSTTGHNITNAGVEGYSRQETVFDTLGGQLQPGGYVGSGVGIETIRRITDEFLTRQSFIDTSRLNELEVFSAGIEQLDFLLASEETGLAGSLNELFASVQAASESPTSLPLRQQIISNAERLVDRYQGLYSQVEAIVAQSDSALVSQVQAINRIAEGVANINRQIQSSAGIPSNDQPNDLLDRRDQLLKELAELISFTTSTDGSTVNVFVGGGQGLVLGGQANQLETVGSGQNLDIAINVSGRSTVITQRIAGGQLGGILQLRSQGLGTALNQLGLVQTLVSHSFNTLHNEGVDLNGLTGGDIFTSINDRHSQLLRVAPAVTNSDSNAIVSLTVDDPAALTASDYALEFTTSGSNLAFKITRQSDGVIVSQGAIPPALFPQSITVSDGFTVNLEYGDIQTGDKFTLSPARINPLGLDVLVEDPASLAFALPVSTGKGVGNIGTGAISQAAAPDIQSAASVDAELLAQLRAQTPPLVVRFTSASTYDILDNSDPAQPVQLAPPLRNLTFLPGRNNPILDFAAGSSIVTTSGAFAFTATAGAIGTTNNGNSGEAITITTTDSATGTAFVDNVAILAGESAAIAATRLNAISGVSATANTELQLQLSDDGLAAPLELRLNGVELTSVAQGPVPSPLTTDFLAQRINQLFAGSGVVATANGPDLSIRSLQGEDLTLENFGVGVDSITVTSINGATSAVNVVAGQELVVAGTVDVVLDDNVTLSSTGGFLGGSVASSLPAFLGYDVSISGQPQAGDEFIINNGNTGAGDNRNALALAALQLADLLKSGAGSLNEVYAQLVGSVGNKASAARIDREAAQSILTQTEQRISAVSGVNIDEEAAKLLQFEQAYNASARVIAIARSTFDSLIAAFS